MTQCLQAPPSEGSPPANPGAKMGKRSPGHPAMTLVTGWAKRKKKSWTQWMVKIFCETNFLFSLIVICFMIMLIMFTNTKRPKRSDKRPSNASWAKVFCSRSHLKDLWWTSASPVRFSTRKSWISTPDATCEEHWIYDTQIYNEMHIILCVCMYIYIYIYIYIYTYIHIYMSNKLFLVLFG